MVKKILKILGIIILLLIVAGVSLPYIFKDKIVETVKTEANKNVNAKIDFGDFDLSLFKNFPDFTFEINDVLVSGVQEFEKDTLANIGGLNLTVDLMSIISGDTMKINTIKIDRPNIYAHVLENGKANWDIMKETGEEEVEVEDTGEATPFSMQLQSFEIKEGKVRYNDESMDFYTSMDGLDFHLDGDFTQDFTSLNTTTDIRDMDMVFEGVNYFKDAILAIKADMDADLANSKYTFKENEFKINDLVLGMDGTVAMPGDDIDMDLTYFAKKSEFKTFLSLVPAIFTKDFESLKTSGTLALDGYVKGIYNEEKMPGFGLNLKVENGMFQYPDLPTAVNNVNIDAHVDNKTGDPDHTVVDIPKFHLELGANPVDIRLHLTTPVSDANIDANIKGTIDLASVKDMIPLEEDQKLSGVISSDVELKGKMSSIENEQYDQFHAAGSISVKDMTYADADLPQGMHIAATQLNFSPQFLELASFDSKIGATDISANGRIENYMAYTFKENESLKGNFNMTSQNMDLNEFMEEEEEATEETTEETTEEEPMEVVEVPANIDFVMTSSIGKLLYDNIEMTNVKGEIVIRDQTVDMTNLSMNLLGGSMVMNGSYGTKDPKKPTTDFGLNISEFDIPTTVATFNTVEKLAPVAGNTTGSFSGDIKFACTLDNQMEPVMNTVNGGGVLKTKNVVVEEYGPIAKVAEKLKIDKYKTFALNDVDINFQLENGNVIVEPFDFNIGSTKVNIAGITNLDQTINYDMGFEIPRKEFGGSANTALDNMAGKAGLELGETVNVMAKVTGTVTDPQVSLDLKETAGSMVDDLKKKAQEELDKKKAELEKQAKEELEKQKLEAQQKLEEEKKKAQEELERKKKEEEEKLKKELEKKKKEEEEKAKDKLKDSWKKKIGG